MAEESRLGGQQVMILPEGATRLLGRDAQHTNIAVGYAVASIVRTTLGPKGMDKLLVSDLGDITITNDGATILDELNAEHPVAKIMVEVAKTQDKEVGDGTTTSVILAGELLKNAGDLIDQGIHPTLVIKGYKMAAQKAVEVLKKKARKVNAKDKEVLERIAQISMASKNIGGEEEKKKIAKLAVEAVLQVAEETEEGYRIDKDLVKIEKKSGATVGETQLIKGVLVDKEFAHPGMPKRIENAKIALIDASLEIEKTETDARIEITSPEQMEAFLKQEEKMLKEMVEKIKASGANVLFCQKGIDDVAQHYLAKYGISAVRRVKKSDMEKLAKATGARIVTSLDDLSEKDLGYAGLVEERKIVGEQMVFVENCKNPKSVTLFVRGSTEHVADEAERSVVDAIGSITATLEEMGYVIGGGAIEIELAKELRKYAEQVGGKEQLAIQSFADALEIVPKTLAESAGMDPVDILVQLRTKHQSKEGEAFGINLYDNKVDNMEKIGVIEPLKTVRTAIGSAAEAAEMILRIDDMISAKAKTPSTRPGEGGESSEE
ncbi:MAG: thermosome subunit beta [Candidatus Micrarchaeales archaeon]